MVIFTGESVEEIGKSTAYIGKEKCLVGGDILVMKHKQDPVYLSYPIYAVDFPISSTLSPVIANRISPYSMYFLFVIKSQN